MFPFKSFSLWFFLVSLSVCSTPLCANSSKDEASADTNSSSGPSTAASSDSIQPDIPQIQPKGQSYTKALVIHKHMPDPAWGKMLQYKSDNSVDPNTKMKETVYSFVFQDEKGIIRVANYHEHEDGEGYWEVFIWDLP